MKQVKRQLKKPEGGFSQRVPHAKVNQKKKPRKELILFKAYTADEYKITGVFTT